MRKIFNSGEKILYELKIKKKKKVLRFIKTLVRLGYYFKYTSMKSIMSKILNLLAD